MPTELTSDQRNALKEFIDSKLDLTRVHTEFILGEVQNLEYTDVVTELRILK